MALAIGITGFIACILLLAERYDEEIISVLPVFFCGLITLLYLLAFLHALFVINYIFGALLLYSVLNVLLHKERKALLTHYRKKLFCAGTLVVLITLALVFILLKDCRISISYDDFKYWASSTKALFFSIMVLPLNGPTSRLNMGIIRWVCSFWNGGLSILPEVLRKTCFISRFVVFSLSFVLMALHKVHIKGWHIIPIVLLTFALSQYYHKKLWHCAGRGTAQWRLFMAVR